MSLANRKEIEKQIVKLEDEIKVLKELYNKKEDPIELGIDSYDKVLSYLGARYISKKELEYLKDSKLIDKVYNQIKIHNIQKVFNNGWSPDFNNSTECKYYPWFEYKSCGWSFYDFDYHYTRSHCPAAYYKSEEIVEYIISVKEFENIYIEYIKSL